MLDVWAGRFSGAGVVVTGGASGIGEPFLEIPLDHWKRTIEVNLTSMFLVCQRVARDMIGRAGSRSILLTSSTNGLVGEDQYAHYNASKGGVTPSSWLPMPRNHR
jgi:short-subunit dehydrogenase